ncbi:hypothetical protein FQN60_002827, partial [Etheostoma spectabile]
FVWFCVFVSAFIGRFVTEQQILGPPQDVSVTDVKVLASARFAVSELNNANTWVTYRMVVITSAQVQSIAGFVPAWNYILETRLRRTTCNPAAAIAAGNQPCVSKPKAS